MDPEILEPRIPAMLNPDARQYTQQLSSRLKPKQVCLTYDDGPGDPAPHGKTLAIAEFLHAEKIRAAFFVVGQRVAQPGGRESLAALRKMGHLIGNHTFTHPNLADLIQSGPQQVVRELVDSHRINQEFIGSQPLIFRPPYLGWNPVVCQAAHSVPELNDYHGPIGCDIHCCDWDIGRQRDGVLWSLPQCQGYLLSQLHSQQKGVLLLHDSGADKTLGDFHYRREQQVYELTQWLVEWLKRENYTFVALDDLISA